MLSDTAPKSAPAVRSHTRQNQISLMLIVIWAAYLAMQMTGTWGADLAALYLAGHFHAAGQDGLVYALSEGVFSQTPEAWLPTLQAMGAPDSPAFPYIYPPLWALLVAPLTKLLSFQQFFDLFGLLHAAALAGAMVLARRSLIALPGALPPLLLTTILLIAAFLTYPVATAVFFNQPTAITTALTLLALDRLLSNRPDQAGMALALAAAIKLTPAAFVLVFVLDRNWRALMAFTVTAAVLVTLNIVLAPDLTRSFVQALPHLGEHSTLTRINTSLLPALFMAGSWGGFLPQVPTNLTGILIGPNGAPFPPILALIPKIAALIALIAGYVALRPATAPDQRGLRLAGATLLIGIIVPMFGPLGWQHYYIIPLFLLPMLAPALSTRTTSIALCAFLLITSPSTVLWVDLLANNAPLHETLLTMVWLAVLIGAIRMLSRLARTGGTPR